MEQGTPKSRIAEGCGICHEAILTTDAVAYDATERTFFHPRCPSPQGAHWPALPARQAQPHGAVPDVETRT